MIAVYHSSSCWRVCYYTCVLGTVSSDPHSNRERRPERCDRPHEGGLTALGFIRGKNWGRETDALTVF